MTMGQHSAGRRRLLKGAGFGLAVVLAAAAVLGAGLFVGSMRQGQARAEAIGQTVGPTTTTGPAPGQKSKRRAVRQTIHYPVLTLGASGRAVLRLQQLLADTHYLPLSWHARYPVAAASSARTDPLKPPIGSFHWKFDEHLPGLAELWKPGTYTTLTQGAVMTFESVAGIAPDGVAGPHVWQALIAAAHHRKHSPDPYAYVYVSQGSPESLQLWVDGKLTLTSPANTGIPQAPTEPGTWPVYLRFESTTMQGTEPSGQKYDDPGVPWVSYFHGGDAVHGFPRAAYGFPQSLGCVELPIAQAQTAWSQMDYGTLVTVAP